MTVIVYQGEQNSSSCRRKAPLISLDRKQYNARGPKNTFNFGPISGNVNDGDQKNKY